MRVGERDMLLLARPPETLPCVATTAAKATRGLPVVGVGTHETQALDRKSTRLNSSHQIISYAVFCLKKKSNRIRIGLTKPAGHDVIACYRSTRNSEYL